MSSLGRVQREMEDGVHPIVKELLYPLWDLLCRERQPHCRRSILPPKEVSPELLT